MPVVVLRSKGQFADAVALYSQHLARPPSATRPPPGSGGRGQRRPRSASAAIASTRPQLSPTAESPAADITCNGEEKVCARPRRPAPTTSRARPASAAATGGARTRPAAPKPTHPRPVTATGTRTNSNQGSIRHDQASAAAYYKPGTPLVKNSRRDHGGHQLRRRVVSAGSYPSSSQGNHWNINKSTGSRIDAAPTGSYFYHEHQDLGTDPQVMQRATEFVSKILKAGRNDEGQQTETLSTSQGQGAQRLQSTEASTTGSCIPGSGTPQKNGPKPLGAMERSDARPVRGRRRKRAKKVSKAVIKTTTSGGTTSTQAESQTSRGHQRQPQQQRNTHTHGTATHSSPSTREFPFPPGGAGQDLREKEVSNDKRNSHVMGPPRNIGEAGLVPGPASDGHSANPTQKETNSPCLVTPLAFDVFCSLRPTFFKDSRSKQDPTPGTALGGTGPPSSTRDGVETKKKDCPGPAAFPVVGFRDGTVASTWTSVFGAVCAGAERGRARAEVLKAARREALRRKRRRRCAAAPAAAAAAVPRLQLACDMPTYGKSAAATPPVGTTNDHAVNTSEGEKDMLATIIAHSPDMGAANSVTHGDNDALLPESHQGDAAQPETSPFFRHPFGGGTTRISVNAPRSLQVCPGDRGFRGVPTKTSRRCFSSPRRRRGREGQSSPLHRSFRQSPPRRPATASGAPRDSVSSFGAEASGSHGDFAGGIRRDVRPETAGSFFSKGASKGKSIARSPSGSEKSAYRYSQHGRWTDGDILRRRVDNIADAIAKDLRSHEGTQCDGDTRLQDSSIRFLQKEEDGEGEGGVNQKGEGIESKNRRDHPAAGALSSQTVTNSSKEDRRHKITAPGEFTGVDSESRLPPTSALDAGTDRDGRDTGMVGAPGATDLATRKQYTAVAAGTSVCATGDNRKEQSDERNASDPDGVHVLHTPGLYSIDAACLTGEAASDQCVQNINPSPAAGDLKRDKSIAVGEAKALDLAASPTPAPTATFGSPNNTTTLDGNSIERKSRRWSRARPASASSRAPRNSPNSRFCLSGIGRSVSSPGLLQGSHHPGQSLADIVDIAEGWEYPGGRGSRVLAGDANVLAAAGDAVELADCGVAVPDGSASKKTFRVAYGDGADGVVRTGEEKASGNGCKSVSEAWDGHHKGDGLGRDSLADAALEDRGFTRRNRFPGGGSELDAAEVAKKAGCVASTRTASVIVPAKVETPLEFRRATVKLKVLAAEASVAVDGHEKAWRNSKERAEQTFNDLRFAAEEDAQRSGAGAATETRNRLQRIVIESGLEKSRRVDKDAALEEIRRVLRQDTSMYEARAAASDSMLHRMRTLEGENDCCDRSELLECRRNKSLLLLRDRTESERDGLRAACRRRREEAAVMDDTLAEARHARGLLLGHTQRTVERMACLAEYVSVMRRWLGDKLLSRRHARVTSKAINLEFERKSQELDAILKKEAPASTRPNNVDGRSSVEPNQSKSHTKNVAPPANSDLSMSLESLRDASSRLRGLLLVLNTHVLSAQENVELAKPREGGGEIS